MEDPVKKTLAKVVLLTKDEPHLIDDYLAYYNALFDPVNVVVVDNGSRHPDVMKAYERHRSFGGTVLVDRRAFGDAHVFMTEHMQRLAPTCDFLIPVETDEFIFLIPCQNDEDPDGKRVDVTEMRRAIHEHLRGLPSTIGILRFGALWGSCVDPADPGYERGAYARPVTQITRFFDQGWDKLILRSEAFVQMTMWTHHAEIKPGYAIGTTHLLGLLHYHHTGQRRMIDRARPAVTGFGYIDAFHGTLSEQLYLTARHRDLSIRCGHKMNQLDAHLRRLETLRAFRRHLGRLPSSPEEMMALSDNVDLFRPAVAPLSPHDPAVAHIVTTPDAYVRRELAAGRLTRRIPKESKDSKDSKDSKEDVGAPWDRLLYHEPKMDHAFVVAHVARCVASLRPDVVPTPAGPPRVKTTTASISEKTTAPIYEKTIDDALRRRLTEAVNSTDQRGTSTKSKTSYLLVGERPEVIEALLMAVGSSSDSQERVRFVDVATSTRETRSAMAEWVREIVSKHANVLAHPINVRVIRAPMHSVDTFRMLEASYDMIVVATANASDLTMIKSVFLRNGEGIKGIQGSEEGNDECLVLVVA